MRKILVVWGAGLITAAVAYEATALVACGWLWRESNMCGLPAVLVGAISGITVGRLLARRM